MIPSKPQYLLCLSNLRDPLEKNYCVCSAQHSSGLWVVLLHLCKWLTNKPDFISLSRQAAILHMFCNGVRCKVTASLIPPAKT